MEIKVWLTRHNKSGRWLAGVLGVSQTWMTTRLKGDVPIDLNDLERIAQALEVDVFDLLPGRREGRVVGHPSEAAEVVDTFKYRPATKGQATRPSSTKPVFRPPTYPGDDRGNLSLRRPARRAPANRTALA